MFLFFFSCKCLINTQVDVSNTISFSFLQWKVLCISILSLLRLFLHCLTPLFFFLDFFVGELMGDVRMVLRSCTHIMRQKAARASARCYWCFFFFCVCSLLFSLSAFCLQLFRVYFSFVHVFALNWRVTVTRVFVRKREVERKKFTNNNNNNNTHTHTERGEKKTGKTCRCQRARCTYDCSDFCICVEFNVSRK